MHFHKGDFLVPQELNIWLSLSKFRILSMSQILIGRCGSVWSVIGYNVSEMSNEWGAYAGVLPQTADPQSQEVSVHKESLQIDCRIQV